MPVFLVAIDGNEASTIALARAIKLGHRVQKVNDFKIILVSVISDKSLKEDISNMLKPLKQQVEEAGLKCSTVVEVNKSPVNAILQLVSMFNTELVITGSSGKVALERVMSSVSAALVQQCPCSVMVCKPLT